MTSRRFAADAHLTSSKMKRNGMRPVPPGENSQRERDSRQGRPPDFQDSNPTFPGADWQQKIRPVHPLA